MAKTIEELQAENDRLMMEAEGHKKSAEEARKAADAMENAMKAAQRNGKVSLPVPGSYQAAWNDANGKKQKRTVEFKDGRLRVVLPKVAGLENLAGMYVASESLLRIANGEAPLPEHLAQNPALGLLDQEKAANVLTHFAGIKAGFLK